jgi:hypothetical protein
VPEIRMMIVLMKGMQTAGYEVLSAVGLKSSIFWHITPIYSRPCYLLNVCFLLDFFFDPEDGGDMFVQNVGRLSTDYTALFLRRYNSSVRERLKQSIELLFLAYFTASRTSLRPTESALNP